jgi:hypothetical protein
MVPASSMVWFEKGCRLSLPREMERQRHSEFVGVATFLSVATSDIETV